MGLHFLALLWLIGMTSLPVSYKRGGLYFLECDPTVHSLPLHSDGEQIGYPVSLDLGAKRYEKGP